MQNIQLRSSWHFFEKNLFSIEMDVLFLSGLGEVGWFFFLSNALVEERRWTPS